MKGPEKNIQIYVFRNTQKNKKTFINGQYGIMENSQSYLTAYFSSVTKVIWCLAHAITNNTKKGVSITRIVTAISW